ncbi:uncharacterized protein BO97DRAFT_400987 [Aspergillus homomorphus CBS 101889]|uniref:Uncharacterized protein n=1 Tax=Aspergillus homomorphus (strain CBS 101889) TaxID=1450537 RepID=A0A395HGG8_ASPHC|nr:hypothetical protein BO97DRAFT_400987 [Aspergillus homomorphus CBS 101889]RAL07002.1 hypothetical protein BO97DRAFT_400987 [Aspergillus homomorphus CBS 101889]
MSTRYASSGTERAWIERAIFVSLYVLLLESFIQWGIVIYLYVEQHVDAKMTPSLILALVASFFTVPLVILHSFLAWQYNRVASFTSQKTMLRFICSWVLGLATLIWIAASATGLVAISQHLPCLPNEGEGSFWKMGVSCALYRTSVIGSIVSFISLCLYFGFRRLCGRPYDVSLLGVYKRQPSISVCDDSILSSWSTESDNSLKHDIYYVCRRPDITYGRGLYMSSSDNTIQMSTSIEYPTIVHQKSHPGFEAEYDSDTVDLLSGTTLSPQETFTRKLPGVMTSSDLLSRASRTPTMATLHSYGDHHKQSAPVELPGAPLSKSGHTRQKSSVSSLRRLLPKLFSQPLSADPQIRALADSNTEVDVEKEARMVERPPTPKKEYAPGHPLASAPVEKPLPAITAENLKTEAYQPGARALPRSATMNSADAPEVLVPEPLNVRRSNTSQTAPVPRSTYTPYQAPFTPILPRSATRPAFNQASSYRGVPIDREMASRQNSRRGNRRESQLYQFDSSQIPRHTQSQHQPHQNPYGRRWYQEHNRRMSSATRGNDAELGYSNPRRPRSNTYGGLASAPSRLDSIRETGTSVDESPESYLSEANAYQGPPRTNSVFGN